MDGCKSITKMKLGIFLMKAENINTIYKMGTSTKHLWKVHTVTFGPS